MCTHACSLGPAYKDSQTLGGVCVQGGVKRHGASLAEYVKLGGCKLFVDVN